MTIVQAARRSAFLQWVFLALLLATAGYFRFTGLFWGDYSYPHPDERFLIWVVSDIAPVSGGGYFDTANSSLNPVNRGHGFYVYGDFPVIVTRYVAESLFDLVGWMEILQVGRGLSAALDVLTVLVVYLMGQRLAGRWVGTLAGLFSAAAVMQIQQAHFFTSDSFAVFFSTLAIYLGVVLATEPAEAGERRILWLSVWFGATVGLTMACKINTLPVAGLLPLALGLRYLRLYPGGPLKLDTGAAVRLAVYAAAGGVAAFLVFRVAMPYAFRGPGFFDIMIDERWLSNMRELAAQSAGDVDFPPALQWARRSRLFSLQNLMLWGLGMPLGLLAWFGFFVAAWRIVQRIQAGRAAARTAAQRLPEGEAGRPEDETASPAWWDELARGVFPGVLIVWLWTGAYFVWQSMLWNSTMRYQLPIYPTLALLAAWGLGSLWRNPPERVRRLRAWRAGLGAAGLLVLILTMAWAFAFTRIYTRLETRVAASRWIYENVPGPLNIHGTLDGENGEDGGWQQLLAVPRQGALRPGLPYLMRFTAAQGGQPSKVTLQSLHVISTAPASELVLRARIYDPRQPDVDLASGDTTVPAGGTLEQLNLAVTGTARLEPGREYILSLELAPPAPQDGQEPDLTQALVQINGQATLDLYARTETVRYQDSQGGPATLQMPVGGTLRQIRLEPAGEQNPAAVPTLSIIVQDQQTGQQQFASAAPDPDSAQPALRVEPPLAFRPGASYLVYVNAVIPGQGLQEGQAVLLDFLDDPLVQYLPATVQLARPEEPLWTAFTARESGLIREIRAPYAAQQAAGAPGGARLALYDGPNPAEPLAVATAELPAGGSGPLVFTFDPPVPVVQNMSYNLSLAPDGGALAVRGSAPANESTWDMSLPFRLDGYDPYGGIYRGDLNFEMYWDDNEDKRQRFINILNQADVIFFSSNRQWGTTTRVPERYPLTTHFYRELLGCPLDREVIWCYNVAEPGDFEGRLGFDLVEVVTSYPNLGPLEINTQFAEEAFTVYDHPKVMIFRKRADFDPAQVAASLNSVDLRNVVRLTPKRAAEWKDLLLPAWMWVAQQAGGTWSELFPPEGLLNRAPWLGTVVLYLFLWLLGALVYPLLRLALPGLPDRGYSLARTAGLVLFGYLAWICGSFGLAVTRSLLAAIFALIAAAGLLLAYLQWPGLAAEWRARRGYFLAVEGTALGLFVLFLLVRLGNPDLWHPIFGGEKPMDFSYFNAVLRSTVFPPYDPWFAGGYINYYYYGFVLVGMPVKLLGIQPSVAYNLVLPGLFMMVGLGAFGVGANLLSAAAKGHPEDARPGGRPIARKAVYAGLAAVTALLILGNLGTVRMYWQGLQRLAVSDLEFAEGNLIQRLGWAAQGAGKMLRGEASALPYYAGDWYWKPSRAIQPESGNEITEFPAFTFLYADLHAHLMALPVTILVIGWALGVMLGRGCWGLEGPTGRRYAGLSFALALMFGALAAGLLRPANTWDQYTYTALAALALIYRQVEAPEGRPERLLPGGRWTRALLAAALLVVLSVTLYRPFDVWFQQGYNALEPWAGPTTQLSSYLVHWGLFLFVIAAWLFQETVDWMAATPLSALGRLRPHLSWIGGGAALAALTVLALAFTGVAVALVAAPLGLWVALLLLRPGQPPAKRAVLFMIGTAMALTLAVELVAVRGDIGRMNTVFKFYFQAWTLLSLSAAAGLFWLWPRLETWRPNWRSAWTVGLAALVFGAALFPLNAGRAKIEDRMVLDAPHTLDGMEYMNHAFYTDGLTAETLREMDLSQDYRAIRWMQANVSGTPVIVEAHTPEYRHWGTRFTIYTGLPGVIGWNWHQRQQRTVTPDTWVYMRIEDVQNFYRTTSVEQAVEFLRRYNVRYIVLGQLERIIYPGPGLEKFEQQNGVLWDKVYEEGETAIYRVK